MPFVGIEVFRNDVKAFESGYATQGPMVPGIAPREASDRLNIFQSRFDDLYRSNLTYSAGEQLFGLPVTDYSFLHQVKKELMLLQKLYGLYNQVCHAGVRHIMLACVTSHAIYCDVTHILWCDIYFWADIMVSRELCHTCFVNHIKLDNQRVDWVVFLLQVMRGIDGYYDIVWADINIEKINAELTDFQNKWVPTVPHPFANESCLSMMHYIDFCVF